MPDKIEKDNLWERNKRKYEMLYFLTAISFMTSVEIVYFQFKSLSLSEIYLLFSIFSIFITVLEIPTGFIGDKLGQKKSVVIGLVCGIVGFGVLFYAHGILLCGVAYMFLALMLSFMSGSLEALLYETMLTSHCEDQFEKNYGHLGFLSFIGGLVGTVCGGFISIIDISLVAVLDGAMILCGLIAILQIEEPVCEKKKSKLREDLKTIKTQVLDNKNILILSTLFMTSTLIGTKFSQPLMTDAGLSVSYFGIFAAACTLVSALMSKYTSKLSCISLEWAIVIPACILVAIGISNRGGFVLLLLITAGARVFGGIKITKIINENTKSEFRATINSMRSLFFRLGYSIIILLAGFLLNYISLYQVMTVLGMILTVGIVFTLWVISNAENKKQVAVEKSV